jgi:chromosome segregation protein
MQILKTCTGTLRRLKDFQTDGIRRLEQLTRDIAVKTEKIEGFGKSDEMIHRDLTAHYDAHKELESRLNLDEKAFSDIDARLKENDEHVSKIQDKTRRAAPKNSFAGNGSGRKTDQKRESGKQMP